jgi:hypothetical protein
MEFQSIGGGDGMSRYEKLTKQIAGIAHELEGATKALAEAEGRIANADTVLEDLWSSLKATVMNGKETDIRSVETAIREQKERCERDKALIEGLREKVHALEEKREALETERDEALCQGANKWLPSEIEQYERARTDLLRCSRRILAVCSVLSQTDKGREVIANLGEVVTRIPAMRVPSVKQFDRGLWAPDRRDPLLITSPQERRDVLAELTR